ncbi:uncharacterized protein E0L32_003110 [Thyridium curvatum]|uniref:Borealin N-terminal domain-containing protein n=1 Tax=Thyridium curvatum TaxID=1093900 RepID=A0A507BC36_9PEZI|nr:uncharacterized protein E0L32_003110 [Thyridium curvatum]TPX17467.1 hypothetical protein E0L32_003110 [Thyridium curvatum]
MAPPRGRKRKSDQSTTEDAPNMAGQTVPTKSGSPSESPRKKRKVGITLGQKQALIDNLQLEKCPPVTERARKLRAQYNLQAQGLRTRIEIRVNRIPMALRKAKMGDLLDKYSNDQNNKPSATSSAATAALISRPPPVPEKDYAPARHAAAAKAAPAPATRGPGRPPKRRSEELDGGGDKENQDANMAKPQKRARGHPGPENAPTPAQVLSPTSSNSRMRPPPRPASPAKSQIARPVSPVKQAAAATSLLSNMVEKARSTRAAATTRKATTSSTASSATSGTAATRARRGAAAAATPKTTTTTRATRRASGVSESSDGSTATVVRKRTAATAATAASRNAAAATKKTTVMSTIKKGVTSATTRKAAAPKTAAAAAPATTRSGRVLRKRD